MGQQNPCICKNLYVQLFFVLEMYRGSMGHKTRNRLQASVVISWSLSQRGENIDWKYEWRGGKRRLWQCNIFIFSRKNSFYIFPCTGHIYVVINLQLWNFMLNALVNSIYSFFVFLKVQCSLLTHRKATDFMC